jgi:malate/lactate dehydrogenase
MREVQNKTSSRVLNSDFCVMMAGIPMLPENTRAEIALTDGFILAL